MVRRTLHPTLGRLTNRTDGGGDKELVKASRCLYAPSRAWRSPKLAVPGPFHALESAPGSDTWDRAERANILPQNSWARPSLCSTPGLATKAELTTSRHSGVPGQGLTSPSTAAAARLRERRGGPGGPAGLLQGPARPSCTSCR